MRAFFYIFVMALSEVVAINGVNENPDDKFQWAVMFIGSIVLVTAIYVKTDKDRG